MFLHGVAVVITAILMPLVLYWFLESNVQGLQHQALREQAESLARHLTIRSEADWSLDLPAGLRDQYSEAYGRYAYAVLDDAGHVLFSSRADRTPIFPVEARSSQIAFFEVPRGDRTISGASLRKELDGRIVWIQVAEDLAHRDVLTDDVVASFFRQVGWITVPILLLLLAVDIAIFRRAVKPLLRASDQAKRISPTRIDVRLPTEEIPKEIVPLQIARMRFPYPQPHRAERRWAVCVFRAVVLRLRSDAGSRCEASPPSGGLGVEAGHKPASTCSPLGHDPGKTLWMVWISE